MSNWASLSYSNTATFGERVFVNMTWRANMNRSNRLIAWIAPIVGREDDPGAWRFRAMSGKSDLPEHQSTELLASVFTLIAGHGYVPEKISFAALAVLAQRPQHQISAAHREAAKHHIAKQKADRFEPILSLKDGLSQ